MHTRASTSGHTALPGDWSIHSDPDSWPRERGLVFLAPAIRQLGLVAFFGWDENTPEWANHQAPPYFPPASVAFADGQPVTEEHERYGPVVRELLSPASYAAEVLGERLRALYARGDEDPEMEREADRLAHRAHEGLDHSDPITAEHWEEVWAGYQFHMLGEIECAETNLPLVGETLLDLTQSGRLRTYARPIGGGAPQAIPPEFWRIDEPLLRMASCRIDFSSPLDAGAPGTHWIFVDQRDFDDAVHEAEAARRPAGTAATGSAGRKAPHAKDDPSPAARAEDELAKREAECAAWLLREIKNRPPHQAVQEALFDEAAAQFGLGAASIARAWRSATDGEYRYLRRGGRRPGSKNR
jgi:hypothetical protein